MDKRKCFVILGMKEKKNPNKFMSVKRENWPKLSSNRSRTAHRSWNRRWRK
ncbi:hypothetical protein E2C01_057362 [Portunus trituberculatus]|uniref:Uncharacterized protein n=1 Tax=Portunus trituberculatus TaxID=210409 RepID=A0A5B7H1P1_PORTR|nr:hypothetical protein [Portunus trituberculatus]